MQQITAWQTRRTREVTRWYFENHYGASTDPGFPAMFCDPKQVGSFAIEADRLREGEDHTLFRLLVTVTMFQRRQDVQIMRVLRGISPQHADELTSPSLLMARADGCGCPNAVTNRALIQQCDLGKDNGGRGICGETDDPYGTCYLKTHTELLRRYGHFGKVPTSIALMIHEGGGSLNAIRERCLRAASSELDAAKRLVAALSSAWRVSDKIANMYLSIVCNPDIFPGAPWQDGIDWRVFVVVDSNVDLFLKTIGFEGPWTYEHRRQFILHIAERVDLGAFRSDVRSYNPRLVQQAMFLFMSESNRRAIQADCSNAAKSPCGPCSGVLRGICPRLRDGTKKV